MRNDYDMRFANISDSNLEVLPSVSSHTYTL